MYQCVTGEDVFWWIFRIGVVTVVFIAGLKCGYAACEDDKKGKPTNGGEGE